MGLVKTALCSPITLVRGLVWCLFDGYKKVYHDLEVQSRCAVAVEQQESKVSGVHW